MAVVYFDSSALVKLVVEERGSDVAAQLWDGTRHSLRGADAVHVASALALGNDLVIMTAWDRRLRAGAESSGITVAPVTIEPS